MPKGESQGSSGRPPEMKAPSNLRGYRLLRALGSGGMGAVWLAEKSSSRQPVAIKFLNAGELDAPDGAARFEREIESLRAIRHPNVVNVFDWSLQRDGNDARPYVVMELLQGEGLEQLLRRQPVLAPRLAVNILLQVLDGLAAAHALPVIHRDLGPANIFLVHLPGGTYSAKILDFGIALPLGAASRPVEVPEPGVLMGKPGYVAPEMFTGRPLDGRADIFACGMILHRMLTGKLPYRETQSQPLWMERYEDRTSDREYPHLGADHAWIPVRLGDVVAKAIRRRPEERYATVEQLQAELRELEDGMLRKAGESMPPPLPVEGPSPASEEAAEVLSEPPLRWPPPRWLLFGGSAVLALLIGVLVLARACSGGGSGTARIDPCPPPPPSSCPPPLPPGNGSNATAGSGEDAGDLPAGAAADVAPADAGAAEPAEVVVAVVGAPPGATVRVGDLLPEGDPPQIRLKRSQRRVQITVDAPGYAPFARTIVPTEDQVVQVEMRRLRRPLGGGEAPR